MRISYLYFSWREGSYINRGSVVWAQSYKLQLFFVHGAHYTTDPGHAMGSTGFH